MATFTGRQVYYIAIAIMMVITGSINTLSVKWADIIESENSVGKVTEFNHPFLQAVGMFLGEMSCIVAYYMTVCWQKQAMKRNKQDIMENESGPKKRFNPLLFFIPAMCDMIATSIMFVGLTLTSASSFQMLRGSVMIFTGILTVLFLKRRLEWFRWLGLVVIFAGLIVVGLSDFLLSKDEDNVEELFTTTLAPNSTNIRGVLKEEEGCSEASSNEIVGDLLIVAAQIIVAFQSVYEEKVLKSYDVSPLQAVGWEGIFGFSVLCILLIPMGYITVGCEWAHGPHNNLEDALDGLAQLGNSGWLTFAFCGTIVSIAFFNFAGMLVTKELSATTRVVLDSIRTLVIWMFSIGLAWQQFHYLQIVGFVVLVSGMLLYNDLVIMPIIRKQFGVCLVKEKSAAESK